MEVPLKNIYVKTGSGPMPVKIPWKIILAVVVAIIFLIAVKSSFYSIESNEEGVVQRFGKYINTVGPGLHFKFPMGIDKVTHVPVEIVFKDEFGYKTLKAGVTSRYDRQRPEYDKEALMLTGDLNIAMVEWDVQYKIKNAKDYLFNVRNPQGTLRDMSESAMREVIGDRSVTESITMGKDEIKKKVKGLLQEILDYYKSGVEVKNIFIKRVVAPKDVQAAFNEVNEAQQEKDKTVNQAQEEYERIIPRAEGEALKTVNQAYGYKEERINMASGDVARFKRILEEYKKAPEITRQRIFLETMEKVLPFINRKIIIDESARSILPFMDLTSQGRSK